MLVALILASGKGTRLAPLSTVEKPKQYLSLMTKKTLVEDTVDRVTNFIKKENIFVVTNIDHEHIVSNIFNDLPKENIILEPEMKETLASISHAVSYISKIKGDDVEYLILPSDHYIDDLKLFEQSVIEGHERILENKNYLLYGIIPTHPSTEYGYIETKDVNSQLKITNFIEKPKSDVALELVRQDNYFWNNGIMIITKELLFNSVKEILPKQYELLNDFQNGKISTKDYFSNTVVDNFSRSILEKQDNMDLIAADYLWYDIGGFDSLFEILERLHLNEKLIEIKDILKNEKTPH